MRTGLQAAAARAAYLEDDTLRYTFYFALCRSVLQTAAVTLIDYCWRHADDYYQPTLSDQAKKLLQCSDGDLVTILDVCVPIARESGWAGCARSWFDVPGDRAAESLRTKVERTVTERNHRMGHGVLDRRTVENGLAVLPETARSLLEGLEQLLPVLDAGRLSVQIEGTPFDVQSLPVSPGAPVVIRRIEFRGSAWRCRFQVLDPDASEDGVEDLAESVPVLAAVRFAGDALRSTSVSLDAGRLWQPAFVVPARQTTTFEGRASELANLLDWWDDAGSRACLVYGEGGIGKTTLVLEFLHDILEGQHTAIKWHPDLLFYFSAKQTRWGVSGLEYIRGVVPSLNDSLREFSGLLVDTRSRDWMVEDLGKLASKAAGVLQAAGVDRKDVLIVLDNTETLARSPTEEAQLGSALRVLSSRVGRVIMTSRRREQVEARPVQVLPMDDTVGAALLDRLAVEYGAQSLVQAGEATLRKVSRRLSGKPILLDVLARYVSRSACGIEEGIRAILRQERGDLGEFLFEDAWGRMDDPRRRVFLVAGQLGGSVNGALVGWSCSEAGVALDDWLASFDETRFGAVRDYGTHFDVVLEPGAREYLSKKYLEASPDVRGKVDQVAATVRERYQTLLRAERTPVTDRVAAAFRTSAARAAKLAASRGDRESAILWYEEAVANDPGNPALLDRFAWYLMVEKELVRAARVATQACEAGPKDADAHFTAGMVAGRLGKVEEADRLLDQAKEFGKGSHLCALQKARARIERAQMDGVDDAERENLAQAALEHLADADLGHERGHRAYKHMRERDRLVSRAEKLRRPVRPKRDRLPRKLKKEIKRRRDPDDSR